MTEEHCVDIVALAHKHDVILVPFGGGSNVTTSLLLHSDKRTGNKRMYVSVDTSRMNKVKWVDKVNKLACIQAGIRGADLDK